MMASIPIVLASLFVAIGSYLISISLPNQASSYISFVYKLNIPRFIVGFALNLSGSFLWVVAKNFGMTYFNRWSLYLICLVIFGFFIGVSMESYSVTPLKLAAIFFMCTGMFLLSL